MADLLANSTVVAANQTITAAERNALRLDMLEQAGEYRVSTGAADAYVVADAAQIVSLQEGQIVIFNANFENGGASTLNFGAFGAKSIKKNNNIDVEAGDIEAGQIVICRYDGTNMQMLTPTASQMSTANSDTLVGAGDADALHTHDTLKTLTNCGQGVRASATATGTENIAHGLSGIPKQILFFAVNGTNGNLWSNGCVDDNRDAKCTSSQDVGGGGVIGSQSAECIRIRTGAVEASQAATVSAWDATNFTLSWTKAGAGAQAVYTWIALY